MHAALKVESVREILGKVGPVIASQVEEAMLGERTVLETEKAERDAEPARRMLTSGQFQKLHQILKALFG